MAASAISDETFAAPEPATHGSRMRPSKLRHDAEGLREPAVHGEVVKGILS